MPAMDRHERALQHPRPKILGHRMGRLNAHPHRLDSADCRRARALAVRLAIDPEARDRAELTDVRRGVRITRRAGTGAADILDPMPGARLDAAPARGR